MQFASEFEGLKAQNSISYSGNLSQEKIFTNQAILLSEEIFAIFDFNLPGDFAIFNFQQAMLDTIRIAMIYSIIGLLSN